MLKRILFREFDIIQAQGATDYSCDTRAFIEINQSLSRTKHATTRWVSTLIPRLKYYVTDLCRILVGPEALLRNHVVPL